MEDLEYGLEKLRSAQIVLRPRPGLGRRWYLDENRL